MADSITRSGAAALIPEEVSREIVQGVVRQSAALRLFRRVTMGRNQQRMPALGALVQAGFVTGDTGFKPITKAQWENKFLDAEEVAATVPVPENVFDDADYDLWAELTPRIEEAMGAAIDAAAILGVGKPASWPAAIAVAAAAAGNTVARGTASAATGGIAKDVSALMTLVEDDGFDVTGFAASRRYKGLLRDARDTTGQKLMDVQSPSGTDANGSIHGEPIYFTMRGEWGSTTGDPELVAGDWSQAILGVRQDITYKLLDQASLYNDDGTLAFALAQQDMIALRVKMRIGYQVANPITPEKPTYADATRFPFGVMTRP